MFAKKISWALIWGCMGLACSTPAPKSETPEIVPRRLKVAYPAARDAGSIRALFQVVGAPALAELADCDQDYELERRIAKSKEELFQALPVYVANAPEKYHWCFYAKLLALDEQVSAETDPEARNRLLLERAPFLTYVARIFKVDFEEPRYLEVAQETYLRLTSTKSGSVEAAPAR